MSHIRSRLPWVVATALTATLCIMTVPAQETTAPPDRDTVRRAQLALDYLGYKPGDADGHLGPQTRQAIRDLQRDNSLPATGDLDQETLSLLAKVPISDTQDSSGGGLFGKIKTGVVGGAKGVAKGAKVAGTATVDAAGTTGTAVGEAGKTSGVAVGHAGETAGKATAKAAKVAGVETAEATKTAAVKTRDFLFGGREEGYQAADENLVKEAQRKLAEQRLYQGKIDGQMGTATTEAVRRFQLKQGLEITGELDPDTLRALGIPTP